MGKVPEDHQQDEALELFRERWWVRMSKTWLYRLIHGLFMGRAAEFTIIVRKDDKISLRPWLNRGATMNQTGAFLDINQYLYFMADNMAIVAAYHTNRANLGQMLEDFEAAHGENPFIEELKKSIAEPIKH